MTQDAITTLADNLTSSFISLEKEMSSNRRSEYRDEPDSARQFRREIEREYRAEIRQLRDDSTAKDRVMLMLQAELVQLS